MTHGLSFSCVHVFWFLFCFVLFWVYFRSRRIFEHAIQTYPTCYTIYQHQVSRESFDKRTCNFSVYNYSFRRPFGVEQEYFVQLFVEHDASLKLPTVGDLLGRMFKEQKIRFTKV